MSGKQMLKRLRDSSVAWSWIFNGIRLASGLILLPLLLQLPKEEQGMYYVFIQLIALVPIIDFGFSVTLNRYVSYAMGGATELKAHGVAAVESHSGPNFQLLWRLLSAYRSLYRNLSLATFVLLGIWGTYNVHLKVHETPNPSYTWAAWGVTLFAAAFEMYFGWWNGFLRGINRVLVSARIGVLGAFLYIGLAATLLLSGWGLLSVPIASLISSTVQRVLSRRSALKFLGEPIVSSVESLLSVLWPNSWRVGLQYLSVYLGANVPALIFYKIYGPAAFAEYGLSLQIMGICVGMASVWTSVKWPLVGQYRARSDYENLRKLLRPRIWLQTNTFIVLATLAIVTAPYFLKWFRAKNDVLPFFWFVLLAINSFLEMQFSFWTTLLSTENRIPSLWPTVATKLFTLILFVGLIYSSGRGLAALILAPLIAGSLFNYWYWPKAGLKSLQTRWWDFLFNGQANRKALL